MCGRINVSDNEGIRLLLEMLGMTTWPAREPRFNIAPSAALDVVLAEDTAAKGRQLAQMRWGFVAPWAKAGKSAPPLINARSETVWQKPTFKRSIANNRVIVPINGYYEWQRVGKQRTPHFICASDAPGLLLAGIAQPPVREGDPWSVCLVTTTANDSLTWLHHRMPVILNADEAMRWIDIDSATSIDALMKPASNEVLQAWQVDPYVNNARNTGEKCQIQVAG